MGTMLSSDESDAGWSSGADESSTEGNSEMELLTNGASESGVRRRQNRKSDNSAPLHLERPKSKKRHKRLAEIFGSAKTLLVLTVLTVSLWYYFNSNPNTHISDPSLTIRERTKLRTEKNSRYRPKNEPGMLSNMMQTAAEVTGLRTSVEDLPRGCERPEWQELNFQNCNNIHEIDLLSIMTA